MSLTVRGFNCVTFFRLDPSSALDFLWACSHIPRIWQGRDQKISQVRSKAHVQSPESKSPFFSAFFVKAQPDRVHSAEADDSCTFFFVCAEENREVCATTHFGGAHQLGRPDLVGVWAQQSRLTPRWQKQQLGPGLLLPHPVQAAPPSLLLQWRSGKHQESLGVPHQLHKEMGGQVRCILVVIQNIYCFNTYLQLCLVPPYVNILMLITFYWIRLSLSISTHCIVLPN